MIIPNIWDQLGSYTPTNHPLSTGAPIAALKRRFPEKKNQSPSHHPFTDSFSIIPSGYVKIAIENGHRNS